MIRAEILSTGEELLTGRIVDTNAAFLSDRLTREGVRVLCQTGVGDDSERISRALTEIASRCDMAVVTGGLGPTHDDLTAEAAARAASDELVCHPRALASIQDFFLSRGRQMPETNRKQAFFPKHAEMIVNRNGTAPGFRLRIGKCLFFFLPGVPFEMRHMFEATVLPDVRKMTGASGSAYHVKIFSVFGLPESLVNEMLATFRQRFPVFRLGFQATFPQIEIKIYTDAKDGERFGEAKNEIRRIFGKTLFSENGISMAEQVGRLLRDRKKTLAVAESCTGGLVSHMITEVPGSSDYFKLSAVTYADDMKARLLQVSRKTLSEKGAVSPETAGEMAEGVRRVSGSTYGIATSGVAGPGGGSDAKPVGTVCIGLATPTEVETHRIHFPFPERTRNKQVFAMKALDLLRRKLLDAQDASVAGDG